jgi:ABC-type sugar transport system ATPase subunit
MIAGLEEISDCGVWIDDEFVNDVHPKHRNIAMVFQNYALYPHLTVFDNMAFPAADRKAAKEGDQGPGRESGNDSRIVRVSETSAGTAIGRSTSARRHGSGDCAKTIGVLDG